MVCAARYGVGIWDVMVSDHVFSRVEEKQMAGHVCTKNNATFYESLML